MIPFRTKPCQGEESRHVLSPGRYLVGGGHSDSLAVAGLPPCALDLEVASDAVIAVARCTGFILAGAPFPTAERRLLRPGERLEFGEIALEVDRPEFPVADGTAALARGLLAGALRSATDSPIPTLVWLNGPDCGKRLPIFDEAIFLGRGEGAAARVRDGLASRVHAKLVVKDAAAKIVDLGSANGLLVDGERVATERILRGGELLRIGETEIAFEAALPSPPAASPSEVAVPAAPPNAPPAAMPPFKARTDSGPRKGDCGPLAILEIAAIAGAASIAAGGLAAVWLLMH